MKVRVGRKKSILFVVSILWSLVESLSSDNGDPEDKCKLKIVIFYLQISQLSRSVQCAYWFQRLLKLNM